ncbi:hypothetical protein R69746_04105 [Paraburkholderia aspalathi]|nr:hypothetical protein R69746_04105 [Paraburkholderia aspalathi]
MHNSPTAPGGVGKPSGSSTRNAVSCSAAPSVMGAALVTGAMLDQIVVSVGPYILESVIPRSSSAAARSAGSASPPHSACSGPRKTRPARASLSSSMRQPAGVACMTVAPLCCMSRSRRAPSSTVSREASSTRAPRVSGRCNSSPAMSNDSVVTLSQTSLSSKSRCAATLASRRSRLACVTHTPFGSPVEPDV